MNVLARNHFLPSRCSWAIVLAAGLVPATSSSADDERVDFNRDVRPLLSDKCFKCHGPDERARANDLRLDVKDVAFAIRDSGRTAIVPGEAAASELIRRITHADPDVRMPPADSGKSLTAAQIELLRRWVEQGAAWQTHWSLVPPQRPAIPEVGDTARPRNAIDRFVLARLSAAGLEPAPEADRVTLIRRLNFDLLGLPPAIEDVEEFLADDRPQAFERLVDRLLGSAHYGERMAVDWLDLVRYADTVGYHGDQERQISPYRDYVIRAFNENVTFDRFTVEQLAGDLLPDATLWQKVAAGYNMLGMTSIEGGVQPKEYLVKYAADRVRTTSVVWMGATLGCAECHDHKFDPYTARDFYSFAAFFADIQQQGKENPAANLPVPTPQQAAELERLEKQLRRLEGDDAKRIKAERVQLLKSVRHTISPVSGPPRETRILPRGDWLDESGPVVSPAVPQSLPWQQPAGERVTRLDLARWLVSREHPQTARVFVNRLWKQFFGAGLSRVLDDLGSQGQPPTHPELLDWLAVEFMESGWDVKHMVRLIVTSNTYRQTSRSTDALRRRDPENRYLARQARFRISAEFVRDAALSVSELLVDRLGGDSVRPYQPAGYYAYLNFPKRKYVHSTGPDQYRRGVYVHWQRTFLHPMLLAFDAPSREECTAQRPVSNTPLAALTLLNDPSFVEAARVFAERILREGGDETDARLGWAWRHALSRPPTSHELELVQLLLENQYKEFAGDPAAAKKLLSVGQHPADAALDPVELAAWTSVARAILNTNEMITRN